VRPLSLLHWERRLEEIRAEIPKNCYACGHAILEGDELMFCREFHEVPPADFAATDGGCSTWCSVLETPF